MLQDTIKVEEKGDGMYPEALRRVQVFESTMKDGSISVVSRIDYARRVIDEVSAWSGRFGSRMNKLYSIFFQLEFRNPKKLYTLHFWQKRQLVVDELHAIDEVLRRERLELDHYVTYLREFIHEERLLVFSSLPSVRLFGF